jgi:hypothetical protein
LNYLLAVLLLLVTGPPAVGCSDLHPPTQQQQVDIATSIFRARVTEVKLVMWVPQGYSGVSRESVEARNEIKEALKGEPPKSGVVRDWPYGIVAQGHLVILTQRPRKQKTDRRNS